MNWKILLVLCLLIIGASECKAEIQAQLYTKSRLADDNTYQVGQWNGIQLSYGKDWYGFFSYERAQIIPLWGIGDMTLKGLGIGTSQQLSKRFRAFGQVGYYFISHENEGRHPISHDGGEGMTYYMWHQYLDTTDTRPHFDEFEINYGDAPMLTMGVEFLQPINKQSHVGLTLSYTHLQIPESLRVYRNKWGKDCSQACWMQDLTRNYSSINFGINYSWRL